MATKVRSMYAGSSGSAYGVNKNSPGNGNGKWQGLWPTVGHAQNARHINIEAGSTPESRRKVFCFNALGGVGRISNMYASTADGARNDCQGSKDVHTSLMFKTYDHDKDGTVSHLHATGGIAVLIKAAAAYHKTKTVSEAQLTGYKKATDSNGEDDDNDRKTVEDVLGKINLKLRMILADISVLFYLAQNFRYGIPANKWVALQEALPKEYLPAPGGDNGVMWVPKQVNGKIIYPAKGYENYLFFDVLEQHTCNLSWTDLGALDGSKKCPSTEVPFCEVGGRLQNLARTLCDTESSRGEISTCTSWFAPPGIKNWADIIRTANSNSKTLYKQHWNHLKETLHELDELRTDLAKHRSKTPNLVVVGPTLKGVQGGEAPMAPSDPEWEINAAGEIVNLGAERFKYENRQVWQWERYITHKCNGDDNGGAIISAQWNGRGQGFNFHERPEVGDVGGGCVPSI